MSADSGFAGTPLLVSHEFSWYSGVHYALGALGSTAGFLYAMDAGRYRANLITWFTDSVLPESVAAAVQTNWQKSHAMVGDGTIAVLTD